MTNKPEKIASRDYLLGYLKGYAAGSPTYHHFDALTLSRKSTGNLFEIYRKIRQEET